MKTVILAGGFGTRISEESAVRPKPMVEIGGYPIAAPHYEAPALRLQLWRKLWDQSKMPE